MRIKKEFVLREVCGEHVITGEGLAAVNFGRLLALNETAAWLWKQADAMDVAKIIGQWQKEGVIE